MSNPPPASQLCFLSDLPARREMEKVRFLGCVTSYSVSSGILTLEHQYPVASTTKALVDVNLLLESLKSEQTQVGAWVNVIGYIKMPPSARPTKPARERPTVHVQAVLLWSAGPIDIKQYETCLSNAEGAKT
ncbi:uncharacterized protein E0L32_008341 [Thyridium curvatum]|uniref:CST complex subunit Ten1 n=1 Tax=Thyridium curvatum TaxID=1093900 RepID=A0A507ALY0_9PEZI|nr:uncharacterized protein E0L32_008341 [Thyridium curvatum]TPX10772.1 hypothetical protein E0L32_008341 [Thyridium curvatum]